MCQTNRTRCEDLTPFAYRAAVIYVTKSWNAVRSCSVPASACRSRRGEGGCRDIVIQEKCDRAATGWPTRARAHAAPPGPANSKSGHHSADDQPPRQRREELLPAPIRDSVTLDNCPSAVEPLSFVSLLDGHRQLAGCGQEGDARIRPVRFRKCPDRTPTAHSLSCRLRPGLRTTRT